MKVRKYVFTLIVGICCNSRYSPLIQVSEATHDCKAVLAHSTFQHNHILGLANVTIW